MEPIIEQIAHVFGSRGAENYGTEAVTQLQHAVQCATLAVREQAEDTLVTAALLHDIGHILGDQQMPNDLSQNLDDQHERRGYEFLQQHFGPAVADPVRLHVGAKRYLCTTEPAYADQLSPASLKSFHDQGGLMSAGDAAAFRAEPYFRAALRLRRWDDAAKDPHAKPLPLTKFLGPMQRSLLATS